VALLKHRQFAILGGVLAASVLAITAPALGAGTGITVRVEGAKRTLLPVTVARAESGSVTKAGAPSGSCPGSDAIGYFDSATHHKWSGSYSSGLGVEITTVLGETHTFSAKGFYWGIWVNDKFASAGLCDLKLKPGDQLLVAPAPGSGTAYPIVLTAPATAKVGQAFPVRTAYFKAAKGKAKALPGVKVTHAGALTDKNGDATVTVTKTGKVTLVATLKGDIRAEATVNVTK
jgi:hypothetical protein